MPPSPPPLPSFHQVSLDLELLNYMLQFVPPEQDTSFGGEIIMLREFVKKGYLDLESDSLGPSRWGAHTGKAYQDIVGEPEIDCEDKEEKGGGGQRRRKDGGAKAAHAGGYCPRNSKAIQKAPLANQTHALTSEDIEDAVVRQTDIFYENGQPLASPSLPSETPSQLTGSLPPSLFLPSPSPSLSTSPLFSPSSPLPSPSSPPPSPPCPSLPSPLLPQPPPPPSLSPLLPLSTSTPSLPSTSQQTVAAAVTEPPTGGSAMGKRGHVWSKNTCFRPGNCANMDMERLDSMVKILSTGMISTCLKWDGSIPDLVNRCSESESLAATADLLSIINYMQLRL
ncbi:hypothetical protein V5O48_019075, partial [Marasmius crinis-equi]